MSYHLKWTGIGGNLFVYSTWNFCDVVRETAVEVCDRLARAFAKQDPSLRREVLWMHGFGVPSKVIAAGGLLLILKGLHRRVLAAPIRITVT